MEEQLYLQKSSGNFYTESQNKQYAAELSTSLKSFKFLSSMTPVTKDQLLSLYSKTLDEAVDTLGINKYQALIQKQIANMEKDSVREFKQYKQLGDILTREGLHFIIDKLATVDELSAASFTLQLNQAREDELGDIAYLLSKELVLLCHYQKFKSRLLS